MIPWWFFNVEIRPVRESYDGIAEWDASAPKADRDALSQRIRAMPYKDFLHTYYWRAIREQVICRDGKRCRTCGAWKHLDVHHISYDHHGEEHLFLGDLQTQCRDCHEGEHATRRQYEAGFGKAAAKLLYEMNAHRMSRVRSEHDKRERERIEASA